jgi:hypothetical protein
MLNVFSHFCRCVHFLDINWSNSRELALKLISSNVSVIFIYNGPALDLKECGCLAVSMFQRSTFSCLLMVGYKLRVCFLLLLICVSLMMF